MASLAPLRVSLARPRLVAVAHRARSIARNAPTVTTPAGQRAAASLSRRGLCAQAAADTPGAGVVTENNTTAPGSESGDADTLSTSYENGTIDLLLSTEEARKTLQFDKVTLSQQQGSVIFVTGVAIGSAAEAAGVTPGQRLVALSDPITAGQLWFLGGTERLAFVLDAIKSTRAYEMTIIFESEVSITKDVVDAARPPPSKIQNIIIPDPVTASRGGVERKVEAADLAPKGSLPPPIERREREDLYSEKWDGDEYIGGEFWNELTVGIAVFVAVPLVITVIAVASRGVLWDIPTF